MGLSQTSAPSTTPITTAEAKTHCRVTTSDDDTYIDTLVEAATDHVEDVTGLQLVTATWTWTLDEFPESDTLIAPVNPMATVASVKYLDSDGAQQTCDSSNYDTDFTSMPGRIVLAYNVQWPIIRGNEIDSVEVIFTAGYGAASAVPSHLRHAIKLIVGHWYEHREDATDGFAVKTVPRAATSLMNQRGLSWVA